MQLSDIDYELPETRIAQRPIEPRDASKLLVDRGSASPGHSTMSQLVDLVEPGDLLVVNDTKVLPARLRLQRRSGGSAEVLLLEPLNDTRTCWEAMVRPARKLRQDEVLEYFGKPMVRVARRTEAGDTFEIEILDDAPLERITKIGTMPLPPYIRADLADHDRYQTVYANRVASAAAPTAGLHFTPELIAALELKGVHLERVELVVGLATFKPVTSLDPTDHTIHTESYFVPEGLLQKCADAQRVIAVGTTSARALESAATTGVLSGRTGLFITRGYDWKVVDLLLTNFHMPRTSLLLMVDALIGPRWRTLYEEALNGDYRFLSFGDAMLLNRHLS
ncbi:MAG: tRNA preQ1(34) S-adenosylmethionine ribosyltransferase-isomerase QueA [Ilumatobacteraceae bacterium]|nr:tRNA preQ1(34) S-adenosylmethionine ribosyltransferase-isomerase QueA [Ilumatobacteraceae bacterium]